MKCSHAVLLFFIVFVVGLGGCIQSPHSQQADATSSATTRSADQVCPLPTSFNLAKAFGEARKTLKNPTCSYRFEEVFSQLLELAKGDPKPGNRVKFQQFLEWASVDQGIVSPKNAKAIFGKYFSPRIQSLPDDYVIARSTVCDDLEALRRATAREMEAKKIGLIEACADQNRFRQATENQYGALVVLEATCLATNEGRERQ